MAIDGTYVRADRMMGLGEYQVVAGRVEREGRLGGYFAWLPQHRSCDAVAFMRAALEANGWTQKSKVRVLADGADGLSSLVTTAAEKTTRRVLDWFHISMRLRPIEQMAAGIVMAAGSSVAGLKRLLQEKLPRIRWQMWNGKWQAALERMEEIWRTTTSLNSLSAENAERLRRFRQHFVELRDYLYGNWSGLKNYAVERRKGLRISSALAESAMSHLVNQRMGKREPMRWSAKGAHFLLQVRCAVLNKHLDRLFREWHPRFRDQRAALPLV